MVPFRLAVTGRVHLDEKLILKLGEAIHNDLHVYVPFLFYVCIRGFNKKGKLIAELISFAELAVLSKIERRFGFSCC